MEEDTSAPVREFSAHEIHQLYEAMTDPTMRGLIDLYRQLPPDKQRVVTTIGEILKQTHALPPEHHAAADELLEIFSRLAPAHQQLYLRFKREWLPALESHDS